MSGKNSKLFTGYEEINGKYELSNVQWVHKDINIMKNVFSEEYFIKMCNLIVKNNEKNNEKN